MGSPNYQAPNPLNNLNINYGAKQPTQQPAGQPQQPVPPNQLTAQKPPAQVAPTQQTAGQPPNQQPQTPAQYGSRLERLQAMKDDPRYKDDSKMQYAITNEIEAVNDKKYKEDLPFIEARYKEAIDNPDTEEGNKQIKSLDKAMKTIYGKDYEQFNIKSVGGKGEHETSSVMTEPYRNFLLQSPAVKTDPHMELLIKSIPLGNKVAIKWKGKQITKINSDEKAMPPEELMRQSLREKFKREPTFTEIQDALQKQREDVAAKSRSIIQLDKEKGIDISALAEAVWNGQDARKAIKGSRGNPVGTKVESQVLKKHPKFNFAMSDANYVWQTSPVNMRTLNYIEGSLPRIGRLADQVAALKNTNINSINKVLNAVNKEFGRPELTNFEANRNSIVLEVSTALSGSSQGSDTRIRLELENLKSALSPQQIQGAIKNLNEALLARLDAQTSPLYPLDVMRGEKTQQQWSKDLYKKFGGDYSDHNWSSGSQGNAPGLDKPGSEPKTALPQGYKAGW